MPMPTIARRPTLILVLAASLIGCSSQPPADVAQVSPESADAATAVEPIPAPTDAVVLRIGGAVSNGNDGDRLLFDLPTLEELPMTTVTITEPFLNREMEFTGVPMDDLMTVAGADESASTITTTALDDYVIDIPMDLVEEGSVLLATRADGDAITIEDGGPIRIIFLGDSDFELNTDNWIWSVTTMKVVG
jgi:hypothetical protein